MSEPRTKRPRIWIVDDSPTEALITERSLGTAYEFEKFIDGSIVVERLASSDQRPDLLLLDWVMPNMTGDEVCRYLRSNPATQALPIIIVTASRVETEDVVAGLRSGADDYVARPFAPEELRARVDAALRAASLRESAARERRRLDTVNQVGRAFLATGENIPGILDQLAVSVTCTLCDGCSILLLPGEVPVTSVARHRHEDSAAALTAIASLTDPVVHAFASDDDARHRLPPAYAPYIERFGLRGLAVMPFPVTGPIQGVVTVTRDGANAPFEPDDLATIETCIEYAALAVHTALRFDAERAIAAERQAISQYQQQMLAIVGHDLRNPLGALTMGISMLQEIGPPNIASVVRKLSASTVRMTRIIDQLLDVTRAQLGKGLPMAPRECELLPLVRTTIEEMTLAYPGTKFELVDATEVTGQWDPDRLAQVLSNLMGNAAQYGRPKAPVHVQIAAAGDRAMIAVTNLNRDGAISPEVIEVLFDPYKRGRDAKRHHAGLGLGLYIVHEIVSAHGGRIEVESNEETTTFRVTVPLRR